MSVVHIGTSGFTYNHWRGVFYPQDLPQVKWLEFYSQHFSTVEINASFYHQMSRKVYEGWRGKTPENFVFAVKGPRFITHIKRLKDCQEPVEKFLEAVSGLGEKLGPVLWQLPPRWRADAARLEEFLNILEVSLGGHGSVKRIVKRQTSNVTETDIATDYRLTKTKNIRHALEFRDPSWLTPQIFKILKKYGVALVIQDSPHWPTIEEITADFTYLRFHGRESLYSSCYNMEELERWARKIKKWQKQGLDVYAFFNNDLEGYAVKNARELMEFVEG